MKIVGFLQNPWFPINTPLRTILKYRMNPEFHRRVLALTKTGKRLVNSFGDLFYEIHWENANWRHVSKSSYALPPDLEHMKRVLVLQQPELVLTFGKLATDAYLSLSWNATHLSCKHPMAFGDTLELYKMSNDVKKLYEERKSNIRTTGNGQDNTVA